MHRLVLSLLATVSPWCYLPPVDAAIARPFIAPVCAYCPGHRGVEYDLDPGTSVRAAEGGEVTYSGVVAGTRYVVVLQTDGRRATYGGLTASPLTAGSSVRTGDAVGTSGATLYFGLRDSEDTPLDPGPLLGRLRRHAHLVPSSGRAPRPGRAPTLQCLRRP